MMYFALKAQRLQALGLEIKAGVAAWSANKTLRHLLGSLPEVWPEVPPEQVSSRLPPIVYVYTPAIEN